MNNRLNEQTLGLIKYILLENEEREITKLSVYDTWDEAFDEMQTRFMSKAEEYLDENFPRNIKEYVRTSGYHMEDVGIDAYSAYISGSVNYDWIILKATIKGKELNIRL